MKWILAIGLLGLFVWWRERQHARKVTERVKARYSAPKPIVMEVGPILTAQLHAPTKPQKKVIDPSKLHCPTCGVVFAELPKAKRTCPHCKARFLKRYNREDQLVLMTEVQASDHDIFLQYLTACSVVGITREEYWDAPDKKSLFWEASKNFISSAASKNKHNDVKVAYEWQSFVRKNIEGGDWISLKRLSHKAEIAHHVNTFRDAASFEIMFAPRCVWAEQFEGKKFSTEEALRGPLPDPNCPFEVCTCSYKPHPDAFEDIFK